MQIELFTQLEIFLLNLEYEAQFKSVLVWNPNPFVTFPTLLKPNPFTNSNPHFVFPLQTQKK